MKVPWQKRRNDFNHDILKNEYMPALYKMKNILEDKVEDIGFEKYFINEILPRWEEYRNEALNLPVDFETQMSPKVYFDRPPLSEMDDETLQWLPVLIHQLWLIEYPVKKWKEEALQRAKDVDSVYKKLNGKLLAATQITSVEALKPFRNEIVAFIDSINLLSSAISQFPNEVLVV